MSNSKNALSQMLNSLGEEECRRVLENCCAARTWVNRVASARPFVDDVTLFSAAESTWNSLSQACWLEAFLAHPRIGDVNSLRSKFAETKTWATGEQAGAAAADEATLIALAQGNDQYFEKFGFIFIVCATGKTAGEMLSILQSRLPNDEASELQIAAAEQLKITKLRLAKLVA